VWRGLLFEILHDHRHQQQQQRHTRRKQYASALFLFSSNICCLQQHDYDDVDYDYDYDDVYQSVRRRWRQRETIRVSGGGEGLGNNYLVKSVLEDTHFNTVDQSE